MAALRNLSHCLPTDLPKNLQDSEEERERERERERIADLLLKNGHPVDAVEVSMFLDVVDSVLEVAVPLAQVDLQQTTYQVFEVGREVARKPKLHTRAHFAVTTSAKRSHSSHSPIFWPCRTPYDLDL